MATDYTCPNCGDTEFGKCDWKGYEHLCIACASETFANNLEIKWNKELAIYEKRTGQKLDFNQFYLACQAGEVDRNNLKRLPELRGNYDEAMSDLAHYDDPIDPQGDLFMQENDLPF
jgi:RNA polymerase subunit RPABC4/transcription elongation factor Spt4